MAPRGSGLDPFSLRPCLPYALALPAAACSGFRVQGRPQRGSRPLCRPQWEVRGPRHRSGEQTGWQTAPADVGGGRGRRGKRVSGLPSALACPRLVVGWGSRTAPLESPGAPSTRADDLREGHFFSDPFWEGPLGVRHPRTHPSAEAEKTHTTRPVRVRVGVHACGRACARACAPRRAACGRVCYGSALLDFPLPPLWSCLCRGNFAPQRLQSRSPLTVQDDGCQVVPQCSKPLPAG